MCSLKTTKKHSPEIRIANSTSFPECPPVLNLILQDNYHGFLQHAEHICPKGESVSVSADGICILLAHGKIVIYNRRIKTITQFYS